jgi:prolyl-tRNA synthetase
MNRIGGQEITMPVLHPAEIWQQSGRWHAIGGEMFRLKDRNQRDMCLGMTHEEVVAWLAAKEIRSYRDLPQIWYQIQTKERDEARPRSGVLRTREFLMKDSYTLDPDPAALELSYPAHTDAYCRIFDRCGVRRVLDPGMMGLGSRVHGSERGRRGRRGAVRACSYAATWSWPAGCRGRRPATPHRPRSRPGGRTIAEVSAQLRIDPAGTIKSLVFMGPEGPVLALVRGDHALHERKLARALRAETRPAHPDEVKQHLGVAPGSVGPVGARGARIIADESLRQGRYVVGANRMGFT